MFGIMRRKERDKLQLQIHQLEQALERMVDWHERGDMDASALNDRRFKRDLAQAKALIYHAPVVPVETQETVE